MFNGIQDVESGSLAAVSCSICKTPFKLQKPRLWSHLFAATNKREWLILLAITFTFIAIITGATLLAQYERTMVRGLIIGSAFLVCFALFWYTTNSLIYLKILENIQL